MAELYLVSDLYPVETDGEDWPKGLIEGDKRILREAVVAELRRCGPLGTHSLYERIRDRPEVKADPFKDACLFDWLYACVVRAARAADCDPRWHAPEAAK